MKKILFCSYDLNIGGIENALINLLNKLNYEKYDVTLILEKKEGIFLDKLNKNVKVIEYRVSENKNIIARKLKNFIKRVFWIIKNYNKYDFSCCYATYSMPSNFQSYYASKNNCLFIHSDYTNIYHEEYELRNFFDIRRINKFRKIVFVSNESRDRLLTYYPRIKDKSLVINNLVNNNEIEILSKEKINTKKCKDKLFVFVGRLEEHSKKITRMINVFKKLDNAELWIIGDGQDKKLYIDMIENVSNIKMLGAKKNPYPYIKKSDYVIITSDYEGFPVVYNEAIVLNKKIITTIDVSDEYISIDGRFGYLVSKDENEMYKQIVKILKDDDLKCEEVDFNILNETRMEKLENIIDEVI